MSMPPLPQDVSLGAPAFEELVPITCATTGSQFAPRHTSAAAVICTARGIVGLPVIRKPWLSKLFGNVCQPETTVLVVGNPRSSQPVISTTLAEGGEDGKDGGDCVDVGSGWESVSWGISKIGLDRRGCAHSLLQNLQEPLFLRH